jgi:hypothetical protein
MAQIEQVFQITGKQYAINLTTTASTPVQLTGYTELRVFNPSAVMIHLSFASTSAAATTNCVAAVNGTPANSFAIPSGALEIIRVPKNSYVAGLTASSTATVYLTAGRGV